MDKFLLTHPLRGATLQELEQKNSKKISTHTPLAGCNICHDKSVTNLINFYSHTPCGVQHAELEKKLQLMHFYSHTPCGVQQLVYS